MSETSVLVSACHEAKVVVDNVCLLDQAFAPVTEWFLLRGNALRSNFLVFLTPCDMGKNLLVFAERPLAFVREGTCSTADALEVSMEWTTSHNLHFPVDAAVCTFAAAMGWLQTCWTRSVLLCRSMARLGVGLGNGLWCLGRFRGHLVGTACSIYLQPNQQPSVTHSASPRVGGNFTQLLSACKKWVCTRAFVPARNMTSLVEGPW
jgi:hypothetical protein